MPQRDNTARPLATPRGSEFQRFLVEKKLVSAEKARHYLGWVELVLRTVNVDASRPAPEAAVAFLDELSRHQEPWKVQQAREAVRLHRYFESAARPAGPTVLRTPMPTM